MGVSRSHLMMTTPKLWPPASPRTLGIITDEQSDAQFAQPEPQTYPPGVILREDVLPALCLTQTEFAQRLGVSRLTVSEMVNENARYRSIGRSVLASYFVTVRNYGLGCNKRWTCGSLNNRAGMSVSRRWK